METRNKRSIVPSTGPTNQAKVFEEPTNLLPPLPPPVIPTPKTSPKNQFARKVKTPTKNNTKPDTIMPPTKENTSKYNYSRSFSNSEMSMSAKVYSPATNLLPPTPPTSPTGLGPPFPRSTGFCSRQNSQNNGKFS